MDAQNHDIHHEILGLSYNAIAAYSYGFNILNMVLYLLVGGDML